MSRHYHELHDLRKEFTDKTGKVTAMDGELELFQELVDRIMDDPNSGKINTEEVVIKSIKQVAAKLVNDGLTTYTFTIPKAIQMTKDVAAPIYVSKLIKQRTDDILEYMRIYQIHVVAKKFGI